jgi:hypothetical protein
VESDTVKILVMAKEVAKRLGGTITDEAEKEFETDEDYLEIKATCVNLRSLFHGKTIFTTEAEQMKQDLMEVIRKYDPRNLKQEEIFGDGVIMTEDTYSVTDITILFNDLGLDKEELFQQKRGVITGKKYGL